MTTAMHAERLDAVLAALRDRRPSTVLDLGCGEGPLLLRLMREAEIERVVGLDCCLEALEGLQARLQRHPPEFRRKIDLVHGSIMEFGRALAGFDAAILVETIEHLEPDRLSTLERSVFRSMRPAAVIVSTPNREYNVLLGVPPHRLRHPDHRFEWDRARFRRWSAGVAARNGYDVACHDIAGHHPTLGGASQMAVFDLHRPGAGRLTA